MEAIDWGDVWRDVATRMSAHRQAGRAHLLTEDAVRMETVLALGEHGVEPARLAAEVSAPALAGGKLDLAVDPPGGTVIELKCPPGQPHGDFARHHDLRRTAARLPPGRQRASD
ncbi:hypothetical protein GCM10022399_42080 [Terrabacter ginsenosidimutans]|uniref:Uncharacterized protein n=1 Tax=Terrabacter ginsenosidimutans TaxID=490575 RepID=A0ABP7EMT1_9MICO